MADKPLYKPFKNTGKGNSKYFVYVKSDSGGKKKIGFGFKGMDDWKSGTATKEQRKSFRARMKGIKKRTEVLPTRTRIVEHIGL